MASTHLTMGDRRYAQILPAPRVKRPKTLDGVTSHRASIYPMDRYNVVVGPSDRGGFVDPLDWHLRFDDDHFFNWFVRQ